MEERVWWGCPCQGSFRGSYSAFSDPHLGLNPTYGFCDRRRTVCGWRISRPCIISTTDTTSPRSPPEGKSRVRSVVGELCGRMVSHFRIIQAIETSGALIEHQARPTDVKRGSCNPPSVLPRPEVSCPPSGIASNVLVPHIYLSASQGLTESAVGHGQME